MKNRGYITEEELTEYKDYDEKQLFNMLKDKESYKRTAAIKLMFSKYKMNKNYIEMFCEMLKNEKKLYTKIAICEGLQTTGMVGAEVMVNYLGVIGNNQHKVLPEKDCNKKSYPLPRDIIARTLCHMNIEILPLLMKVIKGDDLAKVSEGIDALGFLIFYNEGIYKNDLIQEIITLYEKYTDNIIIKWKIIRLFSSFNNEKVSEILRKESINTSYPKIKMECLRSLKFLMKFATIN